MATMLGLLRIRVLRGINLVVRDIRSSDPYATITMGPQKLRTRVVKQNCNPEWNEELTLAIYDPQLPIHLVNFLLSTSIYTVYDEDLFTKDDKIGEADIDIKAYVESLENMKTHDGDPPEDGAVVATVHPNAENCLARESCIVRKNGKLVQDMCLVLKNVERGSVEIQLEWIHI